MCRVDSYLLYIYLLEQNYMSQWAHYISELCIQLSTQLCIMLLCKQTVNLCPFKFNSNIHICRFPRTGPTWL